MNSLLYSIIVAAILSVTSFVAIILRVSPLTAPLQALSAFFASMFLSVATLMTLLLFVIWKWFPLHAWDEGKIIGVALRQGVFIAAIVTLLLLFHLLGFLTWWIGALLILVFVLVEIALQY